MDVAEAIDVSPTADEERAEAARRTGARWRVVAAWARWERAGLLAHLDATAVDALRDASAAARATSR